MRFPVDITTQMSLSGKDIKRNGTLANVEANSMPHRSMPITSGRLSGQHHRS